MHVGDIGLPSPHDLMVDLSDELVCTIAQGIAAGEVICAVGESLCTDRIRIRQGHADLIQARFGNDVVRRYAVMKACIAVRDGKLLP